MSENTTNTPVITIETLESIATEFVASAIEQRGRLVRFCVAYARMLGARQPELFKRRATACVSGTDGHGSYPPSEEYQDCTGPATIKLAEWDTAEVATSPGFYHTFRRTTEYRGLRLAQSTEVK